MVQPFPDVFSVARRNTVSGHLDPLVFNAELVNEGGHFDTSSHLFKAPTAGIYYFSVSVGLAGGLTAHVELQKNNQAFVNVIRNSTVHPGTETTSRSIMMSLEEGDTIHLVNHADQVAWSTETGLETSFSGFHYQPLHGNMVFFINILYCYLFCIELINVKYALIKTKVICCVILCVGGLVSCQNKPSFSCCQSYNISCSPGQPRRSMAAVYQHSPNP